MALGDERADEGDRQGTYRGPHTWEDIAREEADTDELDMPGVDVPLRGSGRNRSIQSEERDDDRIGLVSDMEQIQKSLSVLTDTANDLYDRLMPIMSPDRGDKKKQEGSERPDGPPLRLTALQINDQVRRLNGKLQDLYHRIEL